MTNVVVQSLDLLPLCGDALSRVKGCGFPTTLTSSRCSVWLTGSRFVADWFASVLGDCQATFAMIIEPSCLAILQLPSGEGLTLSELITVCCAVRTLFGSDQPNGKKFWSMIE